MSDLEDLLAKLERDEAIDLETIADALAKRWPSGVIVAALERDAEADTTTLAYGWRGGWYPCFGALKRLEMIMMREGVHEED